MSRCSSQSEKGVTCVGDEEDLQRVICKLGCCDSGINTPVSGEVVVVARETIQELRQFIDRHPEIATDEEFISEVVCLNQAILEISRSLPDDLVQSMEELADICGISA